MSPAIAFSSRLETKVYQQLGSQRIGYLLGAGASYLGGKGYPLAGQLWDRIKGCVKTPEREEIQAKLDTGANGIEQALDLLDDGGVVEKPHRVLVTDAIAEHFFSILPSLDSHRTFVRRLAARDDRTIPIFCLNYDGLIELSADAENVRLVDGFLGVETPYFEPQIFQEAQGIAHRGKRGMQVDWKKGILHLYKLHGSLGWYQLPGNQVRRSRLRDSLPTNARRLMVPPQHRKATDTTAPPYSALWSDFRRMLCHGPEMVNRLASIGYGLRDEHLNAVMENALARGNLTLLVFAHELAPEVFARWSVKKNAIITTSKQCALYGELGPGHPDLWDFEKLSQTL